MYLVPTVPCAMKDVQGPDVRKMERTKRKVTWVKKQRRKKRKKNPERTKEARKTDRKEPTKKRELRPVVKTRRKANKRPVSSIYITMLSSSTYNACLPLCTLAGPYGPPFPHHSVFTVREAKTWVSPGKLSPFTFGAFFS